MNSISDNLLDITQSKLTFTLLANFICDLAVSDFSYNLASS